MTWLRNIVNVLLLYVPFSFFFLVPVLANDSSLNAGAYGLQPIDTDQNFESEIQLVREHITVLFGRNESEVSAKFVLLNTQHTNNKSYLLGFPDEGHANPGAPIGPMLQVQTFVNGKKRGTELRTGRVARAKNGFGWVPATSERGFKMSWHVVEVIIPADRVTIVERRYRVENGKSNYGYSSFHYVTHTGGSFYGPIGQLDITVKLQDGLTVDDLIWLSDNEKKFARKLLNEGKEKISAWDEGHLVEIDNMPFVRPQLAGWRVEDDSQMSLTWKDFEPHQEREKSFFTLACRLFPYADLVSKP